MVRWSVLAAGAAVVAGAAIVTGASIPPKPPRFGEVRAVPVIGQKIGFFNMAKLMRENQRAKTAVARLNDRKNRLTANLVGMRAMYTERQAATLKENNEGLKLLAPEVVLDRDQTLRAMVALSRQIEDADREINRLLNTQATETIVALYDEIQVAVTELAREHGLTAVLTYPDAVTPEEANSPHVKELKLKPPAAHPFYLDPSVDYTDELIQKVNARFAAGGK